MTNQMTIDSGLIDLDAREMDAIDGGQIDWCAVGVFGVSIGIGAAVGGGAGALGGIAVGNAAYNLICE